MSDTDPVLCLITAMNGSDARAKYNAIETLRRNPDQRAIPILIEALRDADRNVGQSATLALGQTRDPRAFEPLLELALEMENYQAAWALAELNDERALTRLLAVLENPLESYQRRWAAINALGELHDERAAHALIQIWESQSESIHLRGKALSTLGQVGGDKAFQFLEKAYLSPDEDTRMYAFSGFTWMETEEAANYLLAALNDPFELIRHDAEETLERLGRESLDQSHNWPVRPFAKALYSDDKRVRQYAEAALRAIGNDEAREALRGLKH